MQSDVEATDSVTNLVVPKKKSRYGYRYAVLFGLTLVVVLIVVVIAVTIPASTNSRLRDDNPLQQAKDLMSQVPLVDGHNDLPWQLKTNFDNQLLTIDLRVSTSDKFGDYGHTDIPRLREGLVGAQFWAAFIHCKSQYKDALRDTLEQIDVIKRYVAQYPDTFKLVTTAQGIWDAFNEGKIGSLIAVESGHGMDGNLGVLRMLYDLGTRYMTITHNCNTPWADNYLASEDPSTADHDGISPWGEVVIKEMNRLGMMIDLSHVSFDTMRDALEVSTAPVIFSHSSAFTLCNHYRNVPDDVLRKVKDNGGVVMVNFYDGYVCCYPSNDTECNLQRVADHFDYIRDICGIDCVAIGADYDGITTLPKGVEDVTTYPAVIEELIVRGWSDDDIKKVLGLNIIRAMEEAERVRDEMRDVQPFDEPLPRDVKGEANNTCRYYPGE